MQALHLAVPTRTRHGDFRHRKVPEERMAAYEWRTSGDSSRHLNLVTLISVNSREFAGIQG
jgi:hypothetical protein